MEMQTSMTNIPKIIFKDENDIQYVTIDPPVDFERLLPTQQEQNQFTCCHCSKKYKRKSFFVLHEKNCHGKQQKKGM